MQAGLQWLSMIMFTLVSVFLVLFGLLYANVPDMLFFHAQALPEVHREAVKPLYFALMKLVGGASIGLGILGGFAVWGPMRAGVPNCGFVVSVAYIIAFAVAGFTAIRLNELTGADVAWYNMAILSAMTLDRKSVV